MSVGRSLNILSLQLTQLEAATRDVETALLARTSKDDDVVARMVKRLQRIQDETQRLARSWTRTRAEEDHRRFVIGRPTGDRRFAIRDALNAHNSQFAALKLRILRLEERCKMLAQRAGAPTGTDVLNWALDMLGVNEQEFVTAVLEPDAPTQDPTPMKPGASILVPLAAILILLSKFRRMSEDG